MTADVGPRTAAHTCRSEQGSANDVNRRQVRGQLRGQVRPREGRGLTLRTLALEIGDAEALLARGLELLEGLRTDPTPTVRWYRSSAPAVVVGRGQPLPARTGGLPVIRRHSGGGAVLMDASLLSCDVLVPTGHPLLDGDLTTVFVRVGEAWAAALGGLGVPDVAVHRGAWTARRHGNEHERRLAAICYATVGPGEVLARGRKIVGLAQRRRQPGALVQCGLLRRWEPASLLAALGVPGDLSLHERAVGLDDLVTPLVPDELVMAAVERHLRGYTPGHDD